MGNCPEVHSVIQREVSSYKTAQKWAFLDDFHILAAFSRAQKKQKDMKNIQFDHWLPSAY